jgi:pentatricopeptide repeat protein
LDLFDHISSKADATLFTIAFSACTDLRNDRALQLGRTLLDKLPSEFLDDTILMNSAINMLMKFGDVAHAERLFQKLKKKSIVTYGAMMKGKYEWSEPLGERCTILHSGYVTNNLPDKALDLFNGLSSKANDVLYTIVFSACADLSNGRAVQSGKKYLEQMPRTFLNDTVVI